MSLEKAARIAELLIICMALVFVLLGTYAKSFGDPANSRLATVYALTEHGTFYISPIDGEPNKFERRTIDKVSIDGRLLSSKPPVLPLLMTAEYLVMNTLFGLDLDSDEDTNTILQYMSMTLIGGSYLLTLIFFRKTLHLFLEEPFSRVVLLFALAFCTQLWGYCLNLNNHVPGAGMLMVSLYYALGMGFGKLDPKPYRFALFGLTGGMVFAVAIPATIFVLFAGLFLLYKLPHSTLQWAAVPALIPVAVHAGVMIYTTGSPLPVQTHFEAFYLYETSYWRHPRGVDSLNEPKGTYLFNMTLGKSGLFSLYPILLIGIAASLRAIVRNDLPYRRAILAALGAFLIMSLYYLFKTNNYGGEAYGFRWYIVAMPVLLLMGMHLLAGLKRTWQWVFIGLMLGISFFSAWESTHTPWRANQEWTTRFLGDTY